MAGQRRKLAAILSADVVGYARLMGADEAATVDTLKQYRAAIGRIIDRHDGRVVNAPGDNMLAEFPSAVEAVQAAVEVQKSIEGRNAELAEDRRMRFRLGVNLGDVIEDADGTIYGDGVNIAARMEALAEAGGICVSSTIRDAVEGKLDVGFDFLGEQEVKNIARPVRAFAVSPAGRAAAGNEGDSAALPLPDKPSLAVLPFDNLSGDPEQDFFADGIAEDLITALSRFRWLFVTARNSTFAYKGRSPDVREVGRELGVRYVLEGSVRRSGDRVRISAQLIDATDGNHVWAERYDRELKDIFAVQDDITGTIAAAIEPELGAAERERARRKPPENLRAWECYQLGLWHMYQWTAEGNAEARRMFTQSIASDPAFAQAHSGLAQAHFLDVSLGFTASRAASLEAALAAGRKAVALDDKDALGHCVLGRIYTFLGNDAAALDELNTAIALVPSLAFAHYGLCHAFIMIGQFEEAIDEINMAARLSPHDPFFWFFDVMRAFAYLLKGDYEKAVEWAERAARRPARMAFWSYAHLASALGHLGRREDARRALDAARQSEPRFSYDFLSRVMPYGHQEHLGAFYDGLAKAGLDVPDDARAAKT